MESLFETVVKPAILDLLDNGQGIYRCERDLHHHFTACLNRVRPLHLGSRKPILHTEKPAVACYGSGRHGNIDFFVAGDSHGAGSRGGVAIEVNWNYNDALKVERDLCKLIDPKNAYSEAVYFAYGKCADLFNTVRTGLERAFTNFTEAEPGFLLPAGLRIIVAVRKRHNDLVTRSTYVNQSCTPSRLSWCDAPDEKDADLSTGAPHEITEQITIQEETMANSNTAGDRTIRKSDCDLFFEERQSYQTVPLSAYSEQNQRAARQLCEMIARSGARTKRYKGSYSVFGISSQETVAKIVIYEDGKGKLNGDLHLLPGVYALIRANGTSGEQNRAMLAANDLIAALPSSDTIGVAPAHGERFHYLRTDDTNVNRCLEMLRICACT